MKKIIHGHPLRFISQNHTGGVPDLKREVVFMTEPVSRQAIYLDHNGTTPIASEAVSAMLPFVREHFGNPSSSHALGVRAKEGVERAREAVAALLGCGPHDIIFTSGGTESNNMVLKGLVDFRYPRKFHLITSAVEHPAILNPALFLTELGGAGNGCSGGRDGRHRSGSG